MTAKGWSSNVDSKQRTGAITAARFSCAIKCSYWIVDYTMDKISGQMNKVYSLYKHTLHGPAIQKGNLMDKFTYSLQHTLFLLSHIHVVITNVG